jgi:hypothetical protein
VGEAVTLTAGLLTGPLTEPINDPLLPVGTPTGPGGSGGNPSTIAGTGWEVQVRSYSDYTTLLCQVPPKLITGVQFADLMNDVGSGTVTLNQDDPWWKTGKLGDQSTPETILDFECLWQFVQDGVVRFEVLGETIAEQLVDQSEQRLATITCPGTAAALKWAMAAPPGFPDIVLKVDGLLDSFDEVDNNGNGLLDTNIWNFASPSSDIFITPTQGLYNYPGGAGYALATLYPSGTLSVQATSSTTFLGSTPWDATDTLVSIQITPVGSEGSATDSNGNPVAYGTGLDGSELTQVYIQDLNNSSHYALFGLSATEFYVQHGDSKNGVQSKIIATASAFDATNCAYWMITEQGGSGGGSGTFYFWTSPDGQTWTQQWSVVHNWDASYVGFWVTARSDQASLSAIIQNLNSNVTTPSYQGNIYLGEPIMGIWHDLYTTAQGRGTIPFLTTRLTASSDSYGNVWTDTQNVQVTNGTDLYSLLQSFCATINANYHMGPGFELDVGQTTDEGTTLGIDRSQQIIFREGRDIQSKQRTRARNAIQNQIGMENEDGHEISAHSSGSITEWGQREGWAQSSAQVDPVSLEIAAAATVAEQDDEVLSYTMQITPNLPGKTVYKDFGIGDWIGLERPDFTAVDAVQVTGIAVSIDANGVETHELTLVTYMQWLQEQLTYLANKLGGAFVNALGTTPVAPSKYGTGQVPTYFTPAASLGNLADVMGKGGSGGSPLVYNSATGQWQSASSADPSSGSTMGMAVTGSSGTVSVNDGGVTVSAGGTAVAPDGGGTVSTGAQNTTTPTGTTYYDSSGVAKLQVGHQSDGTVTTVVLATGTPTAPDTPAVGGGILGIIVGWDGELGGVAPLKDFGHIEVHVSSTSGFTPTSATLQGTMTAPGLFGVGGLTGGTTYYAKLIAVSQSGAKSAASAQASAAAQTVPANIPAGTISGSQIQTGTITSGNISSTAGILGSQLAASAGIVAGQVTFTARNIGGITTSVQATQPTSAAAGDLWFNSSNGYQLYQYSGSAWSLYQFGTGAIAANSVTASLIAANTITAAQIASGTITATQIAAATIIGSNIAAGTITASLLSAGIIVAGIINGTVVTGSTLQNSSTDPRTSINPNGSITITNTSGVVIFEVGPDGTLYWYSSTGVLQQAIEPGGSQLIYQSTTGPVTYDFEGTGTGSTQSWATLHSTLAASATWSYTGNYSLAITHSGTTQPWGATSPSFTVQGNSQVSMQVTVYTPTALSAVNIVFTFWSGTSGNGTNLGTAAGDQGTIAMTAGEVAIFTLTGATVPSGAHSVTFTVQESAADASGTVFYIDTVQSPGGLVYSNSPVATTDPYGNPVEQGINFIGLPGLTNIFGVEDGYGNQLMAIDTSGNITGQDISAVGDVLVAGQSLQGDILPVFPGGVVQRGYIDQSDLPYPTGGVTSTEVVLFEIDTPLLAGRSYLVMLEAMRISMSTTGNGYVRVRGTLDGTTPGTGSDPFFTTPIIQQNTGVGATASASRMIEPSSNCTLKLCVTLVNNGSSTPVLSVVNSSSSAFAQGTGALTVFDMGSPSVPNSWIPRSGGTGTSGGTQTSQGLTDNTYSYGGGGSLRNHNSTVYQGQTSGNSDGWGSQYALLDFNTVISAISSGATVNQALLRMQNRYTYYSTGTYAYLHTATSSSVSTFSSAYNTVAFSEGQSLVIDVTTMVAAMVAGSLRYIGLRVPSGGTALTGYGYWDGNNAASGVAPYLKITYTD